MFITLLNSSIVLANEAEDQLLAEKYAPRISLHPNEQFFPDSVENYLNGADPAGIHKNTNTGASIVSVSSLGNNYSDPNALPSYLLGNENGVETGQVPIYSYIKDVSEGVVDIIYAAYYPYNKGKTTCNGLEFDLRGFNAGADTSVTSSVSENLPDMTLSSVTLCTLQGQSLTLLDVGIAKIGFSAGVPQDQLNTTFGNHPTDAEYYIVRLVDGNPTKIIIGAHGVYQSYDWASVSKESGTHGIVFSGNGGHGNHLTAGKNRVKVQSSLINESGSWSDGWWKFSLSASYSVSGNIDIYSLDYTDVGGKQWRTWNNVKVFKWTQRTNTSRVDDYATYFTNFPWLQEYEGVRWGSLEGGKTASLEVGIDWRVGISHRFCAPPFNSPCGTASINKSGNESTSVSFAERELSGTDGSVKISRADEMFDKAVSLFLDNEQSINTDGTTCFALGTNILTTKKARLVYQKNGNLVLYSGSAQLWSSGIHSASNKVCFQTDGNLVIYNNWDPLWSTATYGKGVVNLQLQTDCNLVMYNNISSVWSTGTQGQCKV